jgi:moderate conductance mechanosensitive channel
MHVPTWLGVTSVWHNFESSTWADAAVIAGSFGAAWLLSQASGRVAERLARRHERRHDGDAIDTAVITSIKRRETAVSLISTTLRYALFGMALVVSLARLSGGGRFGAVAGASLLVLVIGFAAQRFLTDILSGFFMFFEGWFSVGDNVVLEPLGLIGVVDEVGLRATRLRAVTGEVVHVHNSQILAARVLPSAARDVILEMFVTDEREGRDLIAEVAEIVPKGATRFVAAPVVTEVERLSDDLIRIEARASVAHGREWLADAFLPDLLKERAAEGLIAHGPVVMHAVGLSADRFSRVARAARPPAPSRS